LNLIFAAYVPFGSGFMDAELEMEKSARFCVLQDSKAQLTALQLIISTRQRTRVFGVQNRDTLMHKATGVRHQATLLVSGSTKRLPLVFCYRFEYLIENLSDWEP